MANALQQLELSQSEAARRSGMRQSWINSVVNGTRALGREDLRRLGRIGISADYLLGLTDEMIAPGATRTRRELLDELRAALERELTALVPPVLEDSADRWTWSVHRARPFNQTLESLVADAKRLLHDEQIVYSADLIMGHAAELLKSAEAAGVEWDPVVLAAMKIHREIIETHLTALATSNLMLTPVDPTPLERKEVSQWQSA